MSATANSSPYNTDMAQIRLVKIKDQSDGNANHTANAQTHTKSDVSNYLEKLGTLWMKERGEAQPGVVYRLDRLPAGYTVWVSDFDSPSRYSY
jgi:hypothetical protein